MRRKNKWTRLLGLVFVIFGALGVASSQCTTSGCLDATFGPAGNGEVVTNLTGYTNQGLSKLVLVPLPQPGGGVIYEIGASLSAYPSPTATSPNIGAARYNLDGSLDQSFNGSGIAMTNVSGFTSGTAVQPDGKMVVAANGPLVLRLNVDGTLDTSFGSGGVVKVAPGSGKVGVTSYAVGVQDNGMVVVAGDYGAVMSAWRFTANGSPDTMFGTNGRAAVSFANSVGSRAITLTFQYVGTEQRIILGGLVHQPTGKNKNSADVNFAIARLTSTGQMDSSFGTGGTVVQDSGLGTDVVYGLAVDANNGLIVGGNAGNKAFAISRYQTDGTLDSSFGSGGTALWQIPNTSAYLQDIALQTDGHILATGWASPSSVNNMVVIRLDPNGSLDTTFGASGVVTNNFSASGAISAGAHGLVVQPGDGKIVIGGSVNTSASTSEVGLARYYP